MRASAWAIAILALYLTNIPMLAAQDSWDKLKQLQPGHKIKIVQMDLKAWNGGLVSVSDEAITIRERRRQQEIAVERAKVFRVTELQRSRRGRNAVIGLLAGALLYAAANRGSGDDAEHGLNIAFMGGIGAGVGALVPSHPTIYRARHQAQKPGSKQQR